MQPKRNYRILCTSSAKSIAKNWALVNGKTAVQKMILAALARCVDCDFESFKSIKYLSDVTLIDEVSCCCAIDSLHRSGTIILKRSSDRKFASIILLVGGEYQQMIEV